VVEGDRYYTWQRVKESGSLRGFAGPISALVSSTDSFINNQATDLAWLRVPDWKVPEVPRFVELKLYLERTGELVHRVPLIPISRYTGPSVLKLNPPDGYTCGRIRVSVVGTRDEDLSQGVRFGIRSESLVERAEARERGERFDSEGVEFWELNRPIPSDRSAVSIPTGRFLVTLFRSELAPLVDPVWIEAEIGEVAECVFELKEAVFPVSINSEAMGVGAVSLERESARFAIFDLRDTIYLPVGKYLIAPFFRSGATYEFEVSVSNIRQTPDLREVRR
jgi:hypothetical protein